VPVADRVQGHVDHPHRSASQRVDMGLETFAVGVDGRAIAVAGQEADELVKPRVQQRLAAKEVDPRTAKEAVRLPQDVFEQGRVHVPLVPVEGAVVRLVADVAPALAPRGQEGQDE
jgi:hypothetical protein